MGLRWKVALSLAAIALVATVAVGLVSYRTTSTRLISEVDTSIDEAAVLIRTGRGGIDIPSRQLFNQYPVRRIDQSGAVTDTSFDVALPVDLEEVGAVSGQPRLVVRSTATAESGERFRVHTYGLRNGAFQVARSLEETDRVLDDLQRRTMLIVVAVSIAAAAIGWLIANTVAAPLRRLARAADEVRESGDLDVEVPGTGDDEVGRLGSAFRNMLDALATSREEQQRLVQDAGHELRTPLTSLKTNLAVMRRHREMPDETRSQILDDLDDEVTELTDLVNELVAAASGHLADQPAEPVDMGEAAKLVADRVSRRRQRAIDVEVVANGVAEVPRTGIDRALTNLIDNACKFDSGNGPIVVRVERTVNPERDERVTVHVLDRGPGIPESELGHVFDRFHRAAATRTMPGSGLGLSIARDVVERHGGSVHAQNRSDGGADVGFSLPLA